MRPILANIEKPWIDIWAIDIDTCESDHLVFIYLLRPHLTECIRMYECVSVWGYYLYNSAIKKCQI